MSKSCKDCGSRIHGKYCTWCNEELYIYESQIIVDGVNIMLSDNFTKPGTISPENLFNSGITLSLNLPLCDHFGVESYVKGILTNFA